MSRQFRRPVRRSVAALAGAGLVIALAGGGALLARTLGRASRRAATASYDVVADMGKAGFRTVVWTADTAAEAVELARRIPDAFGRAWAEGPDGRPLDRS
jgi:hypothetical protein